MLRTYSDFQQGFRKVKQIFESIPLIPSGQCIFAYYAYAFDYTIPYIFILLVFFTKQQKALMLQVFSSIFFMAQKRPIYCTQFSNNLKILSVMAQFLVNILNLPYVKCKTLINILYKNEARKKGSEAVYFVIPKQILYSIFPKKWEVKEWRKGPAVIHSFNSPFL